MSQKSVIWDSFLYSLFITGHTLNYLQCIGSVKEPNGFINEIARDLDICVTTPE